MRAATALAARLSAYEALIGDTLVGNYASAGLSYALVGVPSTSTSEGAGDDTTPGDAPPVSIGLEAFLLGAYPPVVEGSSLETHRLTVLPPETVGDDSLLVSDILPLLASLLRARRLDAAMEGFQSQFLGGLPAMFDTEVSEAVRVVVDVDGGSGGVNSARSDSAGAFSCVLPLAPDDFLSVVDSVSRACVDMLRRVHALHDMIERSLNSYEAAPAAASGSAQAAESEFDDGEEGLFRAAGDAASLRALSSGVMAVCVEAVQVRVGGVGLALVRAVCVRGGGDAVCYVDVPACNLASLSLSMSPILLIG